MTLMIIIGVLILIVYFVDMITFFILISENYGFLNCLEALFFNFYGDYVLGTIQNDK